MQPGLGLALHLLPWFSFLCAVICLVTYSVALVNVFLCGTCISCFLYLGFCQCSYFSYFLLCSGFLGALVAVVVGFLFHLEMNSTLILVPRWMTSLLPAKGKGKGAYRTVSQTALIVQRVKRGSTQEKGTRVWYFHRELPASGAKPDPFQVWTFCKGEAPIAC